MRYESGQFGSFDGLDNRRTVYRCFVRMGRGVSDEVASNLRAGFLRGLIAASTTGFAGTAPRVDPCSAAEAYKLFVAITGCLGVDVTRAALALEEVTRTLETESGREAFLEEVGHDGRATSCRAR